MTSEPEMFIPAFCTIRPEMLLRPGTANKHFPFSSPNARYFYFARNSIWWLVKKLGLDQGEVLVPSYHHGVEIEALIDAGARVRYYRIGSQWEVDMEDVRRKIGPKTRALYLTHFAGFPGPVREMKKLAEEFHLPLIEDCALSLFSADGDQLLGTTGDVAIFCLYKVMAMPDGGVLIVNNPNLARQFAEVADEPRSRPPLSTTASILASSLLRNIALRGGRLGRGLRKRVLGVGKSTMKASNITPILTNTPHFNRDHARFGISWLTAHLLRVQDVDWIARTRRRNYLFLLDRLRDVGEPLFDTLPDGIVPLCFPLLVDSNQHVAEALVERGIEAVDFWREGHPTCNTSEFPEVARLRTTLLEVPCHQDINLKTLAKMAAEIRLVIAVYKSHGVPLAGSLAS